MYLLNFLKPNHLFHLKPEKHNTFTTLWTSYTTDGFFLTVDFYDLGNTNEVVSMLNGIVSSINENNIQESKYIKVMPNPIETNFVIEVTNKIKKPYRLKIINNLGKEITFIKDISNDQIMLNNYYKKGIYFILIEDNKRNLFSSKFISNK